MCGIVGYMSYEGTPPISRSRLEAPLRQALSRLAHRGPDHEGVWWSRDGRVVFGHRRLAIIDLASGNQPMLDSEGRVCVVLNGEIYNFHELRDDLEGKGHRFVTRSDTEVLLEAYKEWGEGCLEKLNGMFAFVIWEIERKQLFAARDPLGEKQLYFANAGEGLVFASEPKALFPFGIRRSLDTASLFDFFSFRTVPSPKTLFEGVSRLGPGKSLMTTDGRALNIKDYWRWPESVGRGVPVDPEHDLLEALSGSVRLRLRSDVPVGAFLSGGVDSSLVTALMRKENVGNTEIVTFSVAVEDPNLDESTYQRVIADQYRTRHVTRIVTEKDMLGLCASWTSIADDLVADPSAIALYGLSTLVRDHGIKVVLSGEAADELFGGYGAYVAFASKALRRRLLAPLATFADRVGALPSMGEGIATLCADILDEDLLFGGTAKAFHRREIRRLVCRKGRDGLKAYWSQRPERGTVGEAMLFDLRQRLSDDIFVRTDRATMAASVESRVPFSDPGLVRWALSLSDVLKVNTGNTKVLLKRTASRLLPHDLIYRPKIGFDLPIDRWLRGAFRDEITEYLHARVIPGLDYAQVASMLANWRSTGGQSVRSTQVWFWFALERWYRTWID